MEEKIKERDVVRKGKPIEINMIKKIASKRKVIKKAIKNEIRRG